MSVATSLRNLTFEHAAAHVDDGAALMDLRAPRPYLDVHIPGSLDLVYEFGPGLPSRARDCLPLDLPLVLLAATEPETINAAVSLRGKGFDVIGSLRDGVEQWGRARGGLASTEQVDRIPVGATVLDVGDPGAHAPDDALHIPAEELWARTAELTDHANVTVIAGFGVRAALAVGILERAGHASVSFAWTR
jgi:rhodanese-related sulfurtransferase